MPIEVKGNKVGINRDQLYDKLKEYNIFSRRYFYPLVCNFSCYQSIAVKDNLNIAKNVADRILTLPIYYNLALDDANKICDIIIEITTE